MRSNASSYRLDMEAILKISENVINMVPKLYPEYFIDPLNIRKYHNQGHCQYVASVCVDICKKLDFCDEYSYIEIAALWHDAVYVPGHVDNEYLSAKALLELHPYLVESAGMIRATTIADHLDDCFTWQSNPKQCILLDADLDSLSFDWSKFVEVQCNILAEHKQADLSKSAAFLSTFLKKNRIYRCPESEAKESAARANITKLVEWFGD